MNIKKLIILILVLGAAGAGIYYDMKRQPGEIVLTGIVTTDEEIVSSQIQGRLQKLLVQEGDAVSSGDLLAQIQPQEQLADVKYYTMNNQQFAAQVAQAQADLEYARLTYERDASLYKTKAVSEQDYDLAQTNFDAAKARVDQMNKQVEAAAAQEGKAKVELGYTQILAPVDPNITTHDEPDQPGDQPQKTSWIVDTRAALEGEVVNVAQPIVTLINPDDLWVRADVEETYIDRIRIGDKLQVTLPSGAVCQGTVFYRSVDADYATQRDVSRTKRDIKTFEIRLRCGNRGRRLAVGMTAFVTLPLNNP